MPDQKFDRRAIPSGAKVSLHDMTDGWPLRRFEWPAVGQVRGAILFLGGRGDFFEKYLETFAHWHARGWSITSFDWRGQGGSGRVGSNPKVGHIERFADWIDDLNSFYQEWALHRSGPHIVMGHSMGGHLVLRALIERKIAPDAVVLSAPMFGFDTAPWPLSLVAWLARLIARRGPLDRPAWKENEKPSGPWNARISYLTSDSARYSDEIWWRRQNAELDVGPPSWNWLLEAHASTIATSAPGLLESVAVPILIIGTDGDKLVSPQAIRRFAARLPDGELTMFDTSAKHEVLRECDRVRDKAIMLIDDFLDRKTVVDGQ
jgi:lysophospholipase